MIIKLAPRSDSNIQTKETQQKPFKEQPQKKKQKHNGIWHKDITEILSGLFGGSGGHCIGCNIKIEFDEYRPYCPQCYSQWLRFKWQKAKYCHECGKQATTSINKPLCRSCFEKAYY